VQYAVGVDLSLSRDYTAVSICHAEAASVEWRDGREHAEGRRVIVDDLRVWRPPPGGKIDLGEVEVHVERVAWQYRAQVVLDQYQAEPIQQGLVRRGIMAQILHFTQAVNHRHAMVLYSLLRDHALAIPNDEKLIEELARIILREVAPNVYKLESSRRNGGHHDRATAIAIAADALTTAAESERQVARQVARPGSQHWRLTGRDGQVEQMKAQLEEQRARTDPEFARQLAIAEEHRIANWRPNPSILRGRR
jgi:hypothetical protein